MPPDAATIHVRRCGRSDLGAVRTLLTAAGLPLDGADEAFAQGVVALDRDTIVGTAALEPYGTDGLLRSVAVDAARRGTGVGRALVVAAEALATDLGILELYLLTETATGWFPRLGYRPIARSAAPPGIAGSVEFTVTCRDSGVLMRKSLPGRGRPPGTANDGSAPGVAEARRSPA